MVSQISIPLTQLSWKPSYLLLERRLRIWKKKSSIVVKRLEVPPGREFVEVLEDVWKYILGENNFFLVCAIFYYLFIIIVLSLVLVLVLDCSKSHDGLFEPIFSVSVFLFFVV